MTNEGALRNTRIETVRETTPGVFPADPDLMLYSDNVTDLSWSPTPGVQRRGGLGTFDPVTFHNGPEEHELTVTYDLQRAVVDGSGDPDDPSGDGVVRDTNNDLPNTHAILAREVNEAVPASATVDDRDASGSGSATSKDAHLYLVCEGGRVSGVTYSGDPGSQQPVTAEVTYQFEKVREYQLDQPSAAQLTIENDGTESVDVTVADETNAYEETLTVGGGGSQQTTDTDYDALDSVSLSTDIDGDVRVTDGTETLAIVRGKDHYGHGEGDTGVVALGAGSRASAIGTAYETILGDTITRGGRSVGFEINSVALSFENDIESRENLTPRMGLSAGVRTSTCEATIVGPTESVQKAEQALAALAADIVWTLDNTTFTLGDSRLTEFGGVSKSEGEASMSLDNTFEAETVTVA